MKDLANELFTEMMTQLTNLSGSGAVRLSVIEKSREISLSAIARLKEIFLKTKLSKQEEIEFFREIKPRFTAQVIFHNHCYNLERNMPAGDLKFQRRYVKGFRERLYMVYDEHPDFCRYYRSGLRYLDEKYFLLSAPETDVMPSISYFEADHTFSTSHDFVVARLLAADQMQSYLDSRLTLLVKSSAKIPVKRSSVRWTASKTALTELAYALHASGSLNDGSCGIGEIATYLESVFEIDLGHYHKVFLEIRQRKGERTKFMRFLQERLAQRMEDADEK